MLSTLKTIRKIDIATGVNVFIYYLKKLPIIGYSIDDSWYGDDSLKKVFEIIVMIIKILLNALKKGLYIGLLMVIPACLFYSLIDSKQLPFELVAHYLVVLSGIGSLCVESFIFKVTKSKYICVKYLKMDTESYVKATFSKLYLVYFIYFTLFLTIAAIFLSEKPLDGLMIALIIICLKMFGEAFQLFVFEKTNIIIIRKNVLVLIVGIVLLVAAYGLPFVGFVLPIYSLMYNPIFLLGCLLIFVTCVWYIFVGYKNYNTKIYQTIEYGFSDAAIKDNAKTAQFKALEVKDNDLNEQHLIKNKYKNKDGLNYLNAIFFDRHKRLIFNPVIYRLLVVCVLFIICVICGLVAKEIAKEVSLNLSEYLPLFVFLMYFLSIGDKSCKTMFYNCDKSLLHYGFYREPRLLLKNFTIRLFKLISYSMIIPIAIIIGAIVFCIIFGTGIFSLDMFTFSVSIILLSMFFIIHHLTMYYIFQPYTDDLGIKSPFFKIINGFVYLISFSCFQLDVGGVLFTILLLTFTSVYILIALLIVYKYGWKTFRVK